MNVEFWANTRTKRTVTFKPWGGIRVDEDQLQKMVKEMVSDIADDKSNLIQKLDVGEIHQAFAMTGNTLVHAVVERMEDGGLYVEICTSIVDRRATFTL